MGRLCSSGILRYLIGCFSLKFPLTSHLPEGTLELKGALYGFLLLATPLWAQKPVVGTVVNAASMTPPDQPAHGVAPGSIATIFGRNLAAGAATAGDYPLPLTLNGTSVTVDGIAAPLIYVSPTQINFQAPSSAGGGPTREEYQYASAEVVVITAAGKSDPATMDVYYKGFAVFTLDSSGCGRGAVLNVNPDGTAPVNSPSNSISPGSYLTIFGTGLVSTCTNKRIILMIGSWANGRRFL